MGCDRIATRPGKWQVPPSGAEHSCYPVKNSAAHSCNHAMSLPSIAALKAAARISVPAAGAANAPL